LKQRILDVYHDFTLLLVATKLLTAKSHSRYVKASTFAARPARSKQETARPSLFILNYNLFSGPDRPVAR